MNWSVHCNTIHLVSVIRTIQYLDPEYLTLCVFTISLNDNIVLLPCSCGSRQSRRSYFYGWWSTSAWETCFERREVMAHSNSGFFHPDIVKKESSVFVVSRSVEETPKQKQQSRDDRSPGAFRSFALGKTCCVVLVWIFLVGKMNRVISSVFASRIHARRHTNMHTHTYACTHSQVSWPFFRYINHRIGHECFKCSLLTSEV